MQQALVFHQLIALILMPLIKILQQADIQLLKVVYWHRVAFLDPFFIFLSAAATLITYSVPVLLLIYSYAKKRKVLQRKGWLVLIALTINSAIVDELKKLVHRPRPFVTYSYIHNLVAVSTFSFPSGHTAEVSMLAIALSVLFWGHRWEKALAWSWAILIAYSRLALGVHYPGDVIGSFLISFMVAFPILKGMIHLNFLQIKGKGSKS